MNTADRKSTMLAAYNDLVDDTTVLYDESLAGEPWAAIHVNLERDNSGDFYVDVKLRSLDGAQIAFVLNVARRYELDVREEEGWLHLTRHLNMNDAETDEDAPVLSEAL